jgi:hypothetical protein
MPAERAGPGPDLALAIPRAATVITANRREVYRPCFPRNSVSTSLRRTARVSVTQPELIVAEPPLALVIRGDDHNPTAALLRDDFI